MIEFLDGLPSGIKFCLAIVVVFGPIIAVVLSNYMHGARLDKQIEEKTKINIAVLESRIADNKLMASAEIENQKILMRAEIDKAAMAHVPWTKHDESVSRIYGRIETWHSENRIVMDEIRQGIHEIEITTTEIAGRIDKIELSHSAHGDRLERLERTANGRRKRA